MTFKKYQKLQADILCKSDELIEYTVYSIELMEAMYASDRLNVPEFQYHIKLEYVNEITKSGCNHAKPK